MKTTIETVNGTKYIMVDGKAIDTLSLKSFRPTKHNVSDFYKAGVKIHQLFVSGLPSAISIPYSTYGETWFGDKDYRFENFDRQMELFIENAPDAYVFVNIHIDSRDWWHEENPGRNRSFTHLSQICADEKWRNDTKDYLKALIEYSEEKYGDKVIAYFLLCGSGTEWISRYDLQETHPFKLNAFRKYMNDASLEIPTKEEMERPTSQIFLDPVKDKKIIAYQTFHANLIADTLIEFAKTSKEACNYNKLIGAYYGYIMELSTQSSWNFGHLTYDKVYRSGLVDLVATPSSYAFRDYNDSSAHMVATDTLHINNIQLFNSFDYYTFIGREFVYNPRRICEDKEDRKGFDHLQKFRTDLIKTREKTVHCIQREFMLRLAKRTGMWWFDMLEGWYYDEPLMEKIGEIVEKSNSILGKERESNSEIAVFISSESLLYVNKHSEMVREIASLQREQLSRIGAPFDIYSFNDIDRIDRSQYKLFVFLNSYFMTKEQRDYVNSKIKKDGRSILFTGSVDYVDDNGFSKERMEEMVGMKLSLSEYEEEKIGAMGTLYGLTKPKSPVWYVDDDNAVSLGRLNESRMCGLAKKEFCDYTSYYSSFGNFSAKVLREIARAAGVHIYAEDDTSTYINSGVVGVYNTKNEFTEVILKEDGEYEELFSGKKYKTNNKKVLLPTGENPAQMLILGE